MKITYHLIITTLLLCLSFSCQPPTEGQLEGTWKLSSVTFDNLYAISGADDLPKPPVDYNLSLEFYEGYCKYTIDNEGPLLVKYRITPDNQLVLDNPLTIEENIYIKSISDDQLVLIKSLPSGVAITLDYEADEKWGLR